MVKQAGVKHGANLLSAVEVKSFTRKGRLNDGAGLSLSVDGRGYRRWIFRYTFDDKARELFLGTDKRLTLAQARTQRDKARAQIADGMDPADALSATSRKRRQAVSGGVPTFESFVESYLRDLEPSFKNPKAKQPWLLALNVYAKPLHGLRLNAVTTSDVASVLRPVWQAKPETARRLRWRLEAVFASGVVSGFRNKDPRGQIIQQRNPAAWVDDLEQLPGFKNASTKRAEGHHRDALWRGSCVHGSIAGR